MPLAPPARLQIGVECLRRETRSPQLQRLDVRGSDDLDLHRGQDLSQDISIWSGISYGYMDTSCTYQSDQHSKTRDPLSSGFSWNYDSTNAGRTLSLLTRKKD